MTTMAAYIDPLVQHWKRILTITLATGIIALGIGFLMPVYYKSSAVLLPETEKSKLGTLNQFAGLASLAGVNVSGGDISRLYPSIVSSETVLRNVIERQYQTSRFSTPVNLTTYFGYDDPNPAENFESALHDLRDLMTASFENKTNMVTVTVEMREPQLAADVLNAMVSELDQFMRLKKISSASEQRKWIDDRSKQVEQELRSAEEALRDFREHNRRVSDSPQLLLAQERLLREVQVKSTIYIELKKQSELAKIEEIKNIPLVNVLDQARAPVKKERPKRALNAALMALLALAATCTWYVVEHRQGNPLHQLRMLLGKHQQSS